MGELLFQDRQLLTEQRFSDHGIKNYIFKNLIQNLFNVVWPGFGYYLDQKGHATVNYSIGGGNNTEALFKVEEALGLAPPFTSPVFYNPDVIAWVVTEPIRVFTATYVGHQKQVLRI